MGPSVPAAELACWGPMLTVLHARHDEVATGSACCRQTCDCGFPDKQALAGEVAAWQHDRNNDHAKPDWRFETANIRIKLKHLYPSI